MVRVSAPVAAPLEVTVALQGGGPPAVTWGPGSSLAFETSPSGTHVTFSLPGAGTARIAE